MAVQATQMTEGNIAKQILLFSLPMLLSNLFQQMYNTADLIIVGNFIGDNALAAVGSSGPLIYMLIGFFQGLATGTSVLVAQAYGGADYKSVGKAVHTSIALSLLTGALLTVIGTLCTPLILRAVSTPEAVFQESIVYLRIYFSGVVAVMVYNYSNAVLQAMGDSKSPLYILICASLTNIALDILFIKFFQWGIAGAAWATIISQTGSAVLVIIKLLRTSGPHRLSLKQLGIDMPTLKQTIKIGLPGAFQNTSVSLSNVVVQSSINSFGAVAMAGCTAYQKLEGFGIMPVFSFAMAMTTFVGQNIGAQKAERVQKGTKIGMAMSACCVMVISVFMLLFAPQLMRIFSQDQEVISYGVSMLYTIAPAYLFISITQAIAGALRGAGKTLFPMAVIMLCWCGLRMAWILVGLQIAPAIRTVFLGYPISWIASTVLLLFCLKKLNWFHRTGY